MGSLFIKPERNVATGMKVNFPLLHGLFHCLSYVGFLFFLKQCHSLEHKIIEHFLNMHGLLLSKMNQTYKSHSFSYMRNSKDK